MVDCYKTASGAQVSAQLPNRTTVHIGRLIAQGARAAQSAAIANPTEPECGGKRERMERTAPRNVSHGHERTLWGCVTKGTQGREGTAPAVLAPWSRPNIAARCGPPTTSNRRTLVTWRAGNKNTLFSVSLLDHALWRLSVAAQRTRTEQHGLLNSRTSVFPAKAAPCRAPQSTTGNGRRAPKYACGRARAA